MNPQLSRALQQMYAAGNDRERPQQPLSESFRIYCSGLDTNGKSAYHVGAIQNAIPDPRGKGSWSHEAFCEIYVSPGSTEATICIELWNVPEVCAEYIHQFVRTHGGSTFRGSRHSTAALEVRISDHDTVRELATLVLGRHPRTGQWKHIVFQMGRTLNKLADLLAEQKPADRSHPKRRAER